MTSAKAILLPALAFAISTAAYGADELVNIDFSTSAMQPEIHKKGHFKGFLPKGCHSDFPEWNTSESHSEITSEDGLTYIRFNVDKLDQAVLLAIPLKELEAPASYRVAAKVRLYGSDASFTVRRTAAPYTSYWRGSIAYGGSLAAPYGI